MRAHLKGNKTKIARADIIAFLIGLAALFAGVALGLFSWKLLSETD